MFDLTPDTALHKSASSTTCASCAGSGDVSFGRATRLAGASCHGERVNYQRWHHPAAAVLQCSLMDIGDGVFFFSSTSYSTTYILSYGALFVVVIAHICYDASEEKERLAISAACRVRCHRPVSRVSMVQ